MPSKAGPTVEGPTLTLPELSFDDEGIYECEAYNSEGRDTYQGRINVQGDYRFFIVQQSMCHFIFNALVFILQLMCICFFLTFFSSSSTRVVAGDDRLRSGDQLRSSVELCGCWKTSTLCTLATQWTATQYTGNTTHTHLSIKLLKKAFGMTMWVQLSFGLDFEAERYFFDDNLSAHHDGTVGIPVVPAGGSINPWCFLCCSLTL